MKEHTIQRIRTALSDSRATGRRERVELSDLKLIIFSDHHRGRGNRADDFRQCKRIYHAALGYYLQLDYRLCLLGDVEELWETRLQDAVRIYASTLRLERRFVEQGNYVRFLGNHDETLTSDYVFQHLSPWVAGEKPIDSLTVEVTEQGAQIGELFLAHGHQGIHYSALDRLAVRMIWTTVQTLTGTGVGVPSLDFSLRDAYEVVLYDWAAGISEPVVFVCGHTHRPVFMSNAAEHHVRQTIRELEHEQADTTSLAEKYALLEWLLADRRSQSLIPMDARPC